MKKYFFYTPEEIKLSKKEKRQPQPLFSIVCEHISYYIKKCDLWGFIWVSE